MTGPVDVPVLWSTNCTRILPRLSGMTAISAWVRAFSDASSFWRLLGGGAIVVIVQFHEFELVSRCGGPNCVKSSNCQPSAPQLFEKFLCGNFSRGAMPGNSCLHNFKAEFPPGSNL